MFLYSRTGLRMQYILSLILDTEAAQSAEKLKQVNSSNQNATQIMHVGFNFLSPQLKIIFPQTTVHQLSQKKNRRNFF